MRLLASELRKVIYVRSNWGILIAAVFISALSTAVTVPILQADNSAFNLSLNSTEGADAVYANAVSGYIFAIILGVIMMASEFRHGTAVATFLTSPKRSRVVFYPGKMRSRSAGDPAEAFGLAVAPRYHRLWQKIKGVKGVKEVNNKRQTR